MLGIFSSGVTPRSGLYGLAGGFIVGFARLILQATHEMYGIQWPAALQAFVDINWLYFSFFLFVFTCLLIYVVSLVTPKASPEQIAGLTYDSVTAEQKQAEKEGYGFWEVFHTCVILAIIAGIYIYFW
jgi:SSS family solute:Na+ symporter